MLRFFSEPKTEAALDYLASHDQITVFVGAGCGKEVGLPTWNELVRNLLAEMLRGNRRWRKDADWLLEQLMENDVLSVAERVQVVLGRDGLEPIIRRCIYGADPASEIEPGPMALGVAELRRAYGDRLRIITTNYDQLLVSALRRAGTRSAKSYCTDTQQSGVIHLHGVLGFEAAADGDNVVVLTESDYLAPTGGGWRVDVMRKALEAPCLFLGASLTDLNILMRLHNARSPVGVEHFVLFSRPPLATDVDVRRQARLEDIERRRWSALGVGALFADNYADVAQFAYELASLRTLESTSMLGDRFQSWFNRASRTVLATGPRIYPRNQVAYADALSNLLAGLRSDLRLGDERLSLGVCALFPPDGAEPHERPINWVTSDRTMTTAETLEFLRLTPDSNWTGVKAICAGVTRAEPKDVYASRWRYIWAEPIFTGHPARIPVGAVMLSTMASEDETGLPAPGPSSGGPDQVAAQKVRKVLQDAGGLVLVPNP